jgi:hypothetical protein
MDIRILDLDGSIIAQEAFQRHRVSLCAARDWAPRVRLGCSFGSFRRFERTLADRLGGPTDQSPELTLCGSGDFHHVSLALVRRQTQPFNLLVVDNHPDWMRGVPFLHCGTWLQHAAQLPLVQHIFHAGGDVDFDNSWRWLAPWPALRSGKITVFPAVRRFAARAWTGIETEPLRPTLDESMTAERIEDLLQPYRLALARWPLYISLDKDVLRSADAAVNWDSGHLELGEVCVVLEAFSRAARGRIAGMDIVGDWSPVRVHGLFRRLLHWTEHPPLQIDPAEAQRLNEKTTTILLDAAEAACPAWSGWPAVVRSKRRVA